MDLQRALAFSRYATRVATAAPALATELAATTATPWTWEPTRDALAALQTPDTLAPALRQLRQRVFLHTMVRDLCGHAGLSEVGGAMTTLAEVALAAATTVHTRGLTAAHGAPQGEDTQVAQSLIVVGMGKLGGGELNVSSDIDLVFVYPEEGDTAGPRRISNREYFDRLGRLVIGTLNDVTDDGFVFRVDMRLRPYGESGPLTTSFAGLESYLVTQGRAWERYAWLKARALTGDRRDDLLDLVTPFVYRKYLDYDAYEGLRDIHRQIREQGARRDYAGNVKLGEGGIREIEFVAQALQIVRGGREPGLRVRGTLSALDALSERGLLPLHAAASLRECLHVPAQCRAPAAIPRRPPDAPVARRSGGACAPRRRHGLGVARGLRRRACRAPRLRRDDVRADPRRWRRAHAHRRERRQLRCRLGRSGVAGPTQGKTPRRRVSPIPMRSRRCCIACGRPAVTSSCPRHPVSASTPWCPNCLPPPPRSPDSKERSSCSNACSRCSKPSRGAVAYLALVIEHPPLLPRLANLMGASAWAADYLTRHPLLLDELLDARSLLAAARLASAWRAELARQLAAHPGDIERQMDVLRHFQHAQTFRLLAQDLGGQLTVERLADHLSALADIASMARSVHAGPTWRDRGSAPRFAIVGYGKLGGKELGYASDLDLVFIFDVDPDDPEPEA